MTVNEAIAGAVRAIGDGAPRDELLDWLSEIEMTVTGEIAATHLGDTSDKSPISKQSDGGRLLFAPEPYSKLYINYLVMMSDLAFRDTARYLNSCAVFAESYREFSDWYNRTYMPLGETKVVL